jgi:hypothetical protein
MLGEFRHILGAYHLQLARRSRSRRTASWLLLTDALGSLRDSTDALRQKRFRAAASLFRAVEETTLLARSVSTHSTQSAEIRRRWFAGELILPREARACLRASGGSGARTPTKNTRALSQLTHRTYTAILHGCVPAPKGRLAHVDYTGDKPTIPAGTLAMYYSVLSLLIRSFSNAVVESRLADHRSVIAAWRRVIGEDVRCPVRTRAGDRCSRVAATPEGRCWQHRHAT